MGKIKAKFAHAHKNIVFFYCCCLCTLVAIAMGKMKIGIYCCLIAYILGGKSEMLIGPIPHINFLSKPKNVIGCHGTESLNFLKIF